MNDWMTDMPDIPGLDDPVPPARGLFITATDTEVGKTMIAGAIARSLRDGGADVGVFKPAASGCRLDDEGQLVSDDGEFLASCAGQADAGPVVPLKFVEPLAPNVAAARAGEAVDVGAILAGYRRVASACEVVIAEGVGGLLCPLSEEFWVVHLARWTNLPLVIVARAGLGSINHTLLTIHAARSAGIEVAGVVINRYPAEPGPAAATNVEQIARQGRVKILAVIDDDPDSSVEADRLGPRVRDGVGQVRWDRLIGG